MISDKEPNISEWIEWTRHFPWKKPLTYIALAVSLGLYVIIFSVVPEQPGKTYSYRSREQILLIVFFTTSIIWGIQMSGQLSLKNDSMFGITGSIIALTLFAALMTNIAFYRIDFRDGRIRTGSALSPVIDRIFRSFYYDIFVSNIERVVYRSGGDAPSSVRFIMKDGTRHGIGSNSLPSHSRRALLRYIGEANPALQPILTENFNIDFTAPVTDVERQTLRQRGGPIVALFYIGILWAVLLEVSALLHIGRLFDRGS